MGHINIEIKAKCANQEKLREILKSQSANFKGVDHQVDTYFTVPRGRLKLREGNIENYLIFYEREDKEGPKQSNVILYKTEPQSSLKEILEKSLGILAVVDKQREICFIGNVKFHLDNVKDLGIFVEIEAIDTDGSLDKEKLLEQCNHYLKLFGINESDLLTNSYSDRILTGY
jgi:predicted adenylyl cyclase CyaB